MTFNFLHANIEWKLAHKWVMTCFFFSKKKRKRKDPSCHIMFWKFRKFCKNISFDLSEFKFQNRLKTQNTHFRTFFLTNRTAAAKPKNKFYIFADSDLSINYRSFGTWVSRLSKKNWSLTIFHTFFFFTITGW